MELTQTICRSANRIYLAVQFSIGSHCPKATRRTILEAARTGQGLLICVDPFWLRESYSALLNADDGSTPNDGSFKPTVGDLLQDLRVHQRPIARLGSVFCKWDGSEVSFGQLGDTLDWLNQMLDGGEKSIRDFLLVGEVSSAKLLAFSDMFYGLAVIVAAINSKPAELKGFRRAIALAAASLVVDSSRQLSQEILH